MKQHIPLSWSRRICYRFASALSLVTVCGVIYSIPSQLMNHYTLERQQSLRTWLPAIAERHTPVSKIHQSVSLQTCHLPVKNITYLKIHKTGSSSLAKIINRFGYQRNLSFLLPKDVRRGRNYVWGMESAREVRAQALGYSVNDEAEPPPHYNIFSLHSPYRRQVLEQLMAPDSQYVFSLREPVGQFEASFYYYKFGSALPKELQEPTNIEQELREWLKDPQYYSRQYERVIKEGRLPHFRYDDCYLYVRNSQIRDLGFNLEHQEDSGKVSEYISKLDKEFDFVLITEHFDESLVLMKRQFCWDIEDILYIPENQRPLEIKNSSLPRDISESIRRWNSADQQMYIHFNLSFWDKIKQYGPSFQSDLKAFRDRLEKTRVTCLSETVARERYTGVKVYKLRQNAPAYCKLITMTKNAMMDKIRERQLQ